MPLPPEVLSKEERLTDPPLAGAPKPGMLLPSSSSWVFSDPASSTSVLSLPSSCNVFSAPSRCRPERKKLLPLNWELTPAADWWLTR